MAASSRHGYVPSESAKEIEAEGRGYRGVSPNREDTPLAFPFVRSPRLTSDARLKMTAKKEEQEIEREVYFSSLLGFDGAIDRACERSMALYRHPYPDRQNGNIKGKRDPPSLLTGFRSLARTPRRILASYMSPSRSSPPGTVIFALLHPPIPAFSLTVPFLRPPTHPHPRTHTPTAFRLSPRRGVLSYISRDP